MSCYDCQETPVPCVKAPASCTGESCDEVYPAQCTEYQDDTELTAIGVKKNDRLNEILKKINDKALGTTQAIAVQDTNSVDLSGSGLGSDKLKADLRVDTTVSGNLIKVGVNGVSVVIDDTVITAILTRIKAVPALTAMFCQIAENCELCGGGASNLNTAVS